MKRGQAKGGRGKRVERALEVTSDVATSEGGILGKDYKPPPRLL